MGLLIRDARVGGRLVSISMTGVITAIGTGLAERGEVLDAAGSEVIPGLHDHHVHLLALAAAEASVQCGPPEVADPGALREALEAADRRLPGGEWIRGVGYHESVAGPLDREALDEVVRDRPVRVQHRSGALWVLNSEALRQVGAEEADGRLWRRDGWLRARLPRREVDLSDVGRRAAAWGVTGFTDATPHDQPAELLDLAAEMPQRVVAMASPEAAHDGPAKVLLDDDRLPALDDLVERLVPARRAGRALAFHCVTHVQAALALAAVEQLGARPGDRIEHGALLNDDQVEQLRRLGLTVVTQPGLVQSRGDRYLEDVDEEDRGDLWRLGSLVRAGVAVAAGSDAPYGPADPWVAVEAATTRRTRRAALLGVGEVVERRAAVALFHGRPDRPAERRAVAVGGPADLCVVGPSGVEATVVGGRVVYRS